MTVLLGLGWVSGCVGSEASEEVLVPTGEGATMVDSTGEVAASTADPSTDCTKTTCVYVKPKATGDGSGRDWANACGLRDRCAPSTMLRGATYFLASGTYPSVLFNTPEDAAKIITIKKAIPTDHGTSTGWQAALGAGSASFGLDGYKLLPGDASYWADFWGVNFSTGYWRFDGNVGTGSNAASYGFSFVTNGSHGDETYLNINAAQTATFAGMTIRHVAIACSGSGVHGEVGIAAGTQADVQQPILQHLLLDNCQVLLRTGGGPGANWLVENTYFGRQWSGGADSGLHGIPVQDSYSEGTTFRNNVVTSCAYICIEGEDKGKFYNNLFLAKVATPEGIVSGAGGTPVTNTVIYGNTIVGSNAPILLQSSGSAVGHGNVVRNNLFYGSQGGLPLGDGTIDARNNTYLNCTGFDPVEPGIQTGTTDPFVDRVHGDFHLRTATATGSVLPSPFDVDRDGKPRGRDGRWDRGAYEFSTP